MNDKVRAGKILPRPGMREALMVAVFLAFAPPIATREASAQGGERSGKEVVDAVCAACHGTGKEGAPRIGDKDAWIPRMKQGINSLSRSAIQGHGGMPARGGKAGLTDPEIRNAILYMFNPVSGPAPGKARGPAGGGAAKAALNFKTADGMDIRLGFQPAENLLAYPEKSAERTMHGGVPKGRDYYHVNVSLFDRAGNAPLANAQVEARVEQIGLSSESKKLEPITVNNAVSYGNYFRMAKKTPYVITVRIRKPGAVQPVEARFEHRHD